MGVGVCYIKGDYLRIFIFCVLLFLIVDSIKNMFIKSIF